MTFIIKRYAIFILFIGLLPSWFSLAGDVVHCPELSASLQDRWHWALREANARKITAGYWIGYNIEKMMRADCFIGSYSSDKRKNRPTLGEVVSGMTVTNPDGDLEVVQRSTSRSIMKEIGFLAHYDGENRGLNEMKTSTLDLRVELKGEPLFWLGVESDTVSIDFLKTFFTDDADADLKEQIVSAVGIHPPSETAYAFLGTILTGGEVNSVRSQAAFWLGQQSEKRSLELLKKTAESDRSEDVSEQAIFAISQMEDEKGLKTLIELAKQGKKQAVRNRALFWLGQFASEKATSTLGDILDDESEEDEIQRQALFAIAQQPESLPLLVEIARTHKNPRIRKEAIYMLGQSEDERAIDALISIVEK